MIDHTSRRFQAGLLAGLLAAAAGEITASLTRRGRSPSSGLARGMVDVSPAMVVDGAVALVGRADKPGLAALAAGASALTAATGRTMASRRPLLGAAVAAAPHAAGGVLAVRHRDASTTDTAAATVAGMLVAAAAVAPLRVQPSTALATAAVTGGAVVAADRYARRRDRDLLRRKATLPTPARALPPVPRGEEVSRPGVAPLLARPGQMAVIDITVPEPRVDLDTWRLEIDGQVARPIALGLPELLALPLAERDLLMVCVHNPVGGSRLGCARWTGLGVGDLLDRAGVTDDQGWLVAEAVDGYSNVLPLDVARTHGFLALGMAGQPLPREQGSPARLLVAGRHGQDGNLKWLQRLTVTHTPPLSYWGAHGWRDVTAAVRPGSRIDVPGNHRRVAPGNVQVVGYAWAPPVGVDAVHLQVDGGAWIDADLGIDLGPNAWRPWSVAWDAAPGRHQLRVRCRTATGEWQPEQKTAPYPHGPGGIHAVTVHVGGAAAGAAVRRLVAEGTARMDFAIRSVNAWRGPQSDRVPRPSPTGAATGS